MFERVSEEENASDPCINYMRSGTDESHKVIKKQGMIWHAVFRKKDPVKQEAEINDMILT
jgi:hypothetical protein